MRDGWEFDLNGIYVWLQILLKQLDKVGVFAVSTTLNWLENDAWAYLDMITSMILI